MGKKNLSFCTFRFRSLQLEEADANEINQEIHLANTLFQIKVRQKKYGCRLGRISLFMLALMSSSISAGFDNMAASLHNYFELEDDCDDYYDDERESASAIQPTTSTPVEKITADDLLKPKKKDENSGSCECELVV